LIVSRAIGYGSGGGSQKGEDREQLLLDANCLAFIELDVYV
jgi:hypothetical protein